MSDPNAIGSTEDFEFKALSEARNYRASIISEFQSYLHGDVLEIGAGIGQISEALNELPDVSSLSALEPDSRFHASFKNRLPSLNLYDCLVSGLPEQSAYDAAVMVNVLEHIEDDSGELVTIHRILKEKSGKICILVPARQEIFSKLDSHFGHYRRYNKNDLNAKLANAGYKILKLHYFNITGYFAWGLRYKLLKGMKFDINQVRVFDRVIFPPTNYMESKICRPPIGQSLVAIAQAV